MIFTKKVKNIGLVYINDPSWTGGSDYIINLLNSMSFLPADDQPKVNLFVDNSTNTIELTNVINYRKTKIVKLHNLDNILIRWFYKLFNAIFSKKLDFIYPYPKGGKYNKHLSSLRAVAKYFWIPDFQEEYYPMFFSDLELQKRKKIRKEILEDQNCNVIFSSYAAQKDALKYYLNTRAKTYVVHFANPNPINFNRESFKGILEKYNVVKGQYFIVPNQFWKHKNHIILAEATQILKEKGVEIKILLTGREQDSRDPTYFPSLKSKIEEMNLLEKNIFFLGFIPKPDLYALMAHSRAMIQPSLFEGWSTTIEDGIALNIPIICSNLEVNIEQLGNSALFFDPNNPHDLAQCLQNIDELKKPNFDVNNRVKEFARSILNLHNP